MDPNLTPDQLQAAYKSMDQGNTVLMTSIPPMNHDTTLANTPDGWTQCMITADTKARILSTPGFPSPVPQPSRVRHWVGNTAKKGLALFATESLEFGDLIVSERPLYFGMAHLGPSQDVSSNAPIDEIIASTLQIAEKNMETIISRMPLERAKAFRALANSHLHDGSGPLMGIVRTNGFSASPLSGKDLGSKHNGVCDILSRANHR